MPFLDNKSAMYIHLVHIPYACLAFRSTSPDRCRWYRCKSTERVVCRAISLAQQGSTQRGLLARGREPCNRGCTMSYNPFRGPVGFVRGLWAWRGWPVHRIRPASCTLAVVVRRQESIDSSGGTAGPSVFCYPWKLNARVQKSMDRSSSLPHRFRV